MCNVGQGGEGGRGIEGFPGQVEIGVIREGRSRARLVFWHGSEQGEEVGPGLW
jgi:hypothetical protein